MFHYFRLKNVFIRCRKFIAAFFSFSEILDSRFCCLQPISSSGTLHHNIIIEDIFQTHNEIRPEHRTADTLSMFIVIWTPMKSDYYLKCSILYVSCVLCAGRINFSTFPILKIKNQKFKNSFGKNIYFRSFTFEAENEYGCVDVKLQIYTAI